MHPLHQTLSDLVRINSVNAFYEGGPGEAAIARYIESYFASIGIETIRQEVFSASHSVEARWNVIARLPGKDSTRRILLEAHMDTVSIQGMSIPPFDSSIRDGMLYGRGACDTKAGLTGMMHALADIKSSGVTPPCDVWLAAVVDEEFSFRGITQFCEAYRADAAIVAEPTELRLVTASKGVLRWRIIASGRSAHSSKPHLGINAIQHMARVIAAIEQEDQNLSRTSHPLLGTATCNIGKIIGGVQVNFVPDECVIELDRRLLPGEHVQEVLAHYQAILDRLQSVDPTMSLRMEPPMLVDEAWAVDTGEAIVKTASNALEKLGLHSDVHGVPFGSDASKLGRAGIPTILFGPGSIDQAHAAVEYIELSQVETAFEFYRHCILHFAETQPYA